MKVKVHGLNPLLDTASAIDDLCDTLRGIAVRAFVEVEYEECACCGKMLSTDKLVEVEWDGKDELVCWECEDFLLEEGMICVKD